MSCIQVHYAQYPGASDHGVGVESQTEYPVTSTVV